MQDALRLEVSWHTGGIEGAAQLAAVVNAVHGGERRPGPHVLVYRTVTESTEQGGGGRQGIGLGGGGGGGGGRAPAHGRRHAVEHPVPGLLGGQLAGHERPRHFHEYGTTTEQLAMIAVNARRNAGLNPKAVYRDPMTLDDYFAARMVTTPFRLYDCDAPVDGSTAVVVSAAEHAADVDHPVAASRRSAPRCAGGRRGTSTTTPRRWPRATPAPTCGPAPTSSRRTSTSPSSTTGSASSP